MRQPRRHVPVLHIKVRRHRLPLPNRLQPVVHVTRPTTRTELLHRLPFLVIRPRLRQPTALTMHDISNPDVLIHRLQLPVHLLQRQSPIIKQQRHRIIIKQRQLIVRRLPIILIAPSSSHTNHPLRQLRLLNRPPRHIQLMRPLIPNVSIPVIPLPVPVIMQLLTHHRHHLATRTPQIMVDVARHLLRSRHFPNALPTLVVQSAR